MRDKGNDKTNSEGKKRQGASLVFAFKKLQAAYFIILT